MIKEIAMTLTQKKKLYLQAKDKYYNDPSGKQLMTDRQFDALEDEIREADPEWKGFKAGIKVKKLKAKLPVPIFSLDKVKPGTVDNWLVHHQSKNVVVSDKLDGSAMEIVYRDGLPVDAYTRGDGIIGGKVSYIIPYLRIPQKVGTASFIIRCEGLFTAQAFEKHRKDFDAARNAASGVLNRTDIHPAVKDMSVMILQVLQPNLKPSKGLAWAKSKGFTVVPNKVFPAKKLNGAKLSVLLKARHGKSKFKLDGMVLTLDEVNTLPKAGNPSWAVAFKENVNVADLPVATVKRVIWEVSPHGYLKPTIEYSPIKWEDSELKFATAFNARFVKDNGIGPGAKVKIVRSGDIIPKIEQVMKKAQPSMPDPKKFGAFVWNKTNVDLVLVKPSENTDFRIRRITRFMTEVGVDFMKEGNVRKLHDAGFDNISKLMRATPKDFLRIPGVKDTTANKLYAAIHRVLDQKIPAVKLMDASGTFPRGLGSKRFQQIADRFNLEAILRVSEKDPDKVRKTLMTLNGWSSTTVAAFLTGAPKFNKFLLTTGLKASFAKADKPKAKTQKLAGAGVTWTGYRNKEEEETVVENGGTVESFGSKTTVLIYRPGGKASSKLDKAKSKGVKVLTWDQFVKAYRV